MMPSACNKESSLSKLHRTRTTRHHKIAVIHVKSGVPGQGGVSTIGNPCSTLARTQSMTVRPDSAKSRLETMRTKVLEYPSDYINKLINYFSW